MKKRIKKGLTLKGAKIITAIVTAIFIVLLAIYLIGDFTKNGVGATIFFGMMGLACVSCITAICWIILEQIVLNHIIDTQNKNMATNFLNKQEFTEIYFISKDNSSEHEMLLAILRASGCKFFAKLNEEDGIILIVKDKDNMNIYSCTITNYHYFNLRFKKK